MIPPVNEATAKPAWILALVALGASVSALAQQPRSINLGPSQFLTFATPASWTEGSFSEAWRIHNFSMPASDRFDWIRNGYYCKIIANSVNLFCFDGFDSTQVQVSLGSATDYRALVIRDLTGGTFSLRVWDGQGNALGQAINPINGKVAPGASDTAYLLANNGTPQGGGQLAFFRWYSTAITPAIPPEIPDTAGDHGDFRFENNLTDSGRARLRLSLNGSGSTNYVNSPIYSPLAMVGAIAPGRASFPVVLTSSSFTSLLSSGAPVVLWQQTDGPAAGQFANPAAAATAFTPPLAGSYTIQLTATDALGQSSTVSSTLGAVATDSNGVVVTGNPTLDSLMGPLTRSGTSPWPYYDIGEREIGDAIIKAALANPPSLGAQLSGTSQLLNTPVALVGTGTHYTTEVAVGDYLVVAWNTPEGPGTGRYVDHVISITDDTHLTLSLYQISVPLGSGLSIYHVPPISPTFDPAWWGMNPGAGTNSWNYYDVALALYRLYYRTGVGYYLTAGQQIADYWWQWALDYGAGSNVGAPRALALQSQFIRALEVYNSSGGAVNRFPGLMAILSYFEPIILSQLGPNGANKGDVRENGYVTWGIALGAMSDPSASDTAQYCQWMAKMTPGWIAWQDPVGLWEENQWVAENGGYVTLGPGGAPWRMTLATQALQAVYDALNSPTVCNNPSVAATLLPTIQKAVDFAWSYGRDMGDRGIYYHVNYETEPLTSAGGTGTVSVALGSTLVTGVGTSFTSAFTCNGLSYIGINTNLSIYKVASCADNTHLTITPAYGSQGEPTGVSGSAFSTAGQSMAPCNSLATWCHAPSGDQNLPRFMPGATGWEYLKSGNPQYTAWGDEWFAETFGGPADGPSGVLPCGGPACSGLQSDWAYDAFAGDSGFTNLGKNFGEGSGAPAAQTYLAARLGGPAAAQNVAVDVPTPMLALPFINEAYVLVTDPSGATSLSVCESSPCRVMMDARQGNSLARTIYLSAGAVVPVGDQTVLQAPSN
jgi:hypothetical protein